MTPYASYTAAGQAMRRAAQPGYFTWLEHIRPAAGCTRPIRLVGTVDTVEGGTGRHLHRRRTDELPDSAIYKACGNRRATVCPACAHVYQRDAFQLVRTGLVGGKGIPETVSQHPAVFATFTFLSAFSTGFTSLIVLRMLAGLGEGAIFPVPYLMISELVNKQKRGRIMGYAQWVLNAGYTLPALAGLWAINAFDQDWSWRVASMLGSRVIAT